MTHNLHSPAMAEALREQTKCAVLFAWLCAACLTIAVFDGWWPAFVAAMVDAIALVQASRNWHRLIERAALIYVVRSNLARVAGHNAAVEQARRQRVFSLIRREGR